MARDAFTSLNMSAKINFKVSDCASNEVTDSNGNVAPGGLITWNLKQPNNWKCKLTRPNGRVIFFPDYNMNNDKEAPGVLVGGATLLSFGIEFMLPSGNKLDVESVRVKIPGSRPFSCYDDEDTTSPLLCEEGQNNFWRVYLSWV